MYRDHARLSLTLLFVVSSTTFAGVGDPQLRTDHPWYPGELAYSTFDRLQQTQAEAFRTVIGHAPQTDEERALAAWMWRNTHYAHGEEGKQNLWGSGFLDGDTTTREYWTGLYAHGFGLCGTTHAQWTAELNALLGHGRSRTVGVVGHNALEVFLQGSAYGDGRWVLLDHDVSTVVFHPTDDRLLSINEIRKNLDQLANREFKPKRQRGWPLGGLHPDDPKAYAEFNVVEHLPGYAGPPPMIHLRKGESLRRYYQPGLDDGRTFVFWGRNYRTDGIPGLERSRTWVNQPERFYGSAGGSGFRRGQARFGNAVYVYRPDFSTKAYREGVVAENDNEVILEFRTPFIIAATPPDDSDWGVYKPGCKNGLRIYRNPGVPISVSVDRGTTWHAGGAEPDIDLTDLVKGSQQYWLKLGASVTQLQDVRLEIVTICQANPSMFPRLKDHESTIEFESTGLGIVSVGPQRPQAQAHLVDGAFDTPRATLELSPPRSRFARKLYAAAHVASSNPPDPEIRYQIDYSVDHGSTWNSVVKDWQIVRQGVEPEDFWSQSFCYGDIALPTTVRTPIQIRFRNNGGKRYLRCEAHLGYEVESDDDCRVTFSWSEEGQENQTASKTFSKTQNNKWNIDTGQNVEMKWVEMTCVSPSL